MAQWQRTLLPMRETRLQSRGREDPPEKGMATHASILAWRILWTEEPGGLQSMGTQSQTALSDQTTITTNAVVDSTIINTHRF